MEEKNVTVTNSEETQETKSYGKGKKGGKNVKYSKAKKNWDKKRDLPKNPKGNPMWYFVSEEVKAQVTQLSFQDILGLTTPLNEEIPTFMQVFLNPSPGVAVPSNVKVKSGFNQAMFRFYLQLAAFTGRTQQYAPQDVGTAILAESAAVEVAEFIRRAFGVANMYNERNYAYPKKAIEAMCIDSADFIKNKANYRDRFNYLITCLNMVTIPKGIAYMTKCLTMYQGLYLDDISPMATTIVRLPATTWILDESSYAQGSVLRTYSMCLDYDVLSQGTPVTHNMEYYLNMLEAQITALSNSTTLAVVYSDIMNYAQKQGLEMLKLDYLTDGYFVKPVYDMEVAIQTKHTTVMTCGNMNQLRDEIEEVAATAEHFTLYQTPSNDVYPDVDSNTVVYNPAFHPSCFYQKHNFIISTPNPNPSGDLVLEATRFMSVFGSPQAADEEHFIVHSIDKCDLSDHWCVYAQMIGNDNVVETLSQTTLAWGLVTDALVRAWSKIACAPFIYLMTNLAEGGEPAGFIGDVDYFTELPETWVSKLIKNVSMGLYLIR